MSDGQITSIVALRVPQTLASASCLFKIASDGQIASLFCYFFCCVFRKLSSDEIAPDGQVASLLLLMLLRRMARSLCRDSVGWPDHFPSSSGALPVHSFDRPMQSVLVVNLLSQCLLLPKSTLIVSRRRGIVLSPDINFIMLEFGYNTKSPSVIDSYKVNMSFYLSFVVAPGSSVLPSIHERYSDQHCHPETCIQLGALL